MAGPLYRFLADDHVRLDALLQRAARVIRYSL